MFRRNIVQFVSLINRSHRFHVVFSLWCVLVLLSTANCKAAEENKEQSLPSKEVLRLQLRPLTSEELEKETAAWQSRVQKKVAEVSSLQLEDCAFEWLEYTGCFPTRRAIKTLEPVSSRA